MIESKITVNKQSSEAVRKKLQQLRRAISTGGGGAGGGGAGGGNASGHMDRVNRQVSVWLLRWVNDNFKSQGGKVGKWKPLKLGGRRKKGGGIDTSAKILQDTGRLRASFLPFHSRRSAGVGSDLKYSAIHELGLPMRNIPQRRMLPEAMDKDVTQGLIKIYDAYIERAIRK